MDPDSLPKMEPRKVRFAPKAPPKREQKTVQPKVEKVKTTLMSPNKSYFNSVLMNLSWEESQNLKGKLRLLKLYLAMEGYHLQSDGVEEIVEKEYKEPWDYYTYYPTSVPLRRPYPGNPELLNKEEFGEDPQVSAYDECVTNAAEELGLSDPENTMFFFQLPKNLPTVNPSADTEVNEAGKKAGNPVKSTRVSQKLSKLESLPSGLMGKMLIYKSGAVKVKLGETLYDVSPGLDCVFAQDIVAVNTEEKLCCNLGELNKLAVITPNIDSMLDSMS